MKKIAYIVRSAWQGGVETHVYELMQYAQSKNYELLLVSLADAPVNDKFLGLNVKTIVLNDSVGMSLKSFSNIFNLYRVLKRNKPSVVHSHGTRPIFIGSLVARLALVPRVLVTVHNSHKLMSLDGENRTKIHLLILSIFFHITGFALSNRIIYVARCLRDDFFKQIAFIPFLAGWLNKKSLVIHNSVDSEFFQNKNNKSQFKKQLDLPEDVITIGTVGRLDPNKGIHLLLPAVKSLIDKNNRVVLMVIGDGYFMQELKFLAENLGISKEVVFFGHRDDLLEFYNAMDIFVISSFSEGLPLVLLEAMACKVPVVVTDVGAIGEVVDNNTSGIVVPNNSSNELEKGISILLRNSDLREEIALSGQHVVVSRFTKRLMMESTIAQYD